MANALQLNFSGVQPVRYKVHPLVVFSILDHHKKRLQHQRRAVGTLLGEKIGNEWFVKNCFAISIEETDNEIKMDMKYLESMIEMHKRINPKEIVIGWYSSDREITYTSALIHGAYTKYVNEAYKRQHSPLHITVDTALNDSRMEVKAYVGTEIAVERNLIVRFDEITLDLHAYEVEKIVVDALINGIADEDDDHLDAPAKIMSDFENLELSLQNLLASIDVVTEYVDKVMNGEIEGDENLGRAIAEALSSIPRLDVESFDKMIHTNLQDLLMMIYLANLTRTQIVLANKIQNTIQ